MQDQINKAREEEGISQIKVGALVRIQDMVLLIEKAPLSPTGEKYEIPSIILLENETVTQGLEKALIESVGLQLEETVRYLTHTDSFSKGGKERTFWFLVKVKDTNIVLGENWHSFTWASLYEAHRYPIGADVQYILDLCQK